MQHRISAGAIIEQDQRILMVRCRKEGAYDFWVAPGGGVQGREELAQAALREVREETGLVVAIGPLLYVEELLGSGVRHCKFWFGGRVLGGRLDVSSREATEEGIVQADWLSRADLAGVQAFPPVLLDRYWQDRSHPSPGVQHLGLREMLFE